jgi:hypothetical protein
MTSTENGHLNGHNPTITLALGCNTDLKQISSGTTTMAMIEYMMNYTTKLQLDTSIVFSALCASIKTLRDNPPTDLDGNADASETSRLMMVKTTNSLVGKQELTGQQTAAFLLGRKNCYTSDEYLEYWWSSLLRDIARDVFTSQIPVREVDGEETEEPDGVQQLVIPEDEDDTLIILSPGTLEQELSESSSEEKRFSKLFNDMFYRPYELQSTCT